MSEGTKRFVALAIRIFNAICFGSLLVLDEFDASLHPLLAQEIRNLLNDSGALSDHLKDSRPINPLGAQFILVTHNDSPLDSSRLRRDQIVLLNQTKMGATEMYALSDLDRKPKPGESFQKRYLNGGYGGVPRIRDLRAVFRDMVQDLLSEQVAHRT